MRPAIAFAVCAVCACLVVPASAQSQHKSDQPLHSAQVEVGRKLCKEGRMDLFARFFALLEPSIEDTPIWGELIAFTNALQKSVANDKEYRLVEFENRRPKNDIKCFMDDLRPNIMAKPFEEFIVDKVPRNSSWLIRAKSVSLGGNLGRSLIVAAEDVSFPHGLASTVVIAGGSFRSRVHIRDCIVIAGGSISVDTAIGCILISKDRISCNVGAVGCLLSTNSTLVRSVRSGKIGDCVVKESQTAPVLGVRFFNMDAAGLQMKEIAFGLRTERISNKSFESSGLRAEDVIVEVDGTPISSEVSFAAAICSRMGSQSIRLKILRGKESKTLTINVLDMVRELK